LKTIGCLTSRTCFGTLLWSYSKNFILNQTPLFYFRYSMPSRELIIIRHSYAEDEVPGQGDKSRPLSQQGIEKLIDVKTQLAHLMPEHVLVSPATRTIQTFNHLLGTDQFSKMLEHPALYYGSVVDYIECLDALPEDTRRVWLIGHNPMVTYLGQKICDEFKSGFKPGMAIVLKHNGIWRNVGHVNWELIEIIS